MELKSMLNAMMETILMVMAVLLDALLKMVFLVISMEIVKVFVPASSTK